MAMIKSEKKIPALIITIITLMVVVLTGLMTYLLIGHISGTIDNFFK